MIGPGQLRSIADAAGGEVHRAESCHSEGGEPFVAAEVGDDLVYGLLGMIRGGNAQHVARLLRLLSHGDNELSTPGFNGSVEWHISPIVI